MNSEGSFNVNCFTNYSHVWFQVTFPENVKWLTLEFDSQCGTAQTEDSLQLYIPTRNANIAQMLTSTQHDSLAASAQWWPILRKFHGTNNWPSMAVVLPGTTKQYHYNNNNNNNNQHYFTSINMLGWRHISHMVLQGIREAVVIVNMVKVLSII